MEPLRTQKPRGDVEALPVTESCPGPPTPAAYTPGYRPRAWDTCWATESRNALPTRLLELFLGAPWGRPCRGSVAQKVVAAQLSAAPAAAPPPTPQARRAQLGELTLQAGNRTSPP